MNRIFWKGEIMSVSIGRAASGTMAYGTADRLGPRLFTSLLVALLVGCGSGSDQPADGTTVDAVGTNGPYNKWSWFKDTYWIVPPDGIYSVYHVSGANRFVVTRGQTVFHITDYFNGYFTGAVVVKITEGLLPNCQFVLGQVTPEGQVYMTMYDAKTGAVVNNPLGTMVRKGDEWTMVNQMTAPTQGDGTLSHWAYMVQSRPGDADYEKLPFAEESIPTFMSSCPPGPMIENPLAQLPAV